MKQVPDEAFEKARRWCAREFTKRFDRSSHASFLASKLLAEADEKFDLGGYGVEGWSTETGQSGVDYINMGDPYAATLVCRASRYSARFSFARGGWASFAP